MVGGGHGRDIQGEEKGKLSSIMKSCFENYVYSFKNFNFYCRSVGDTESKMKQVGGLSIVERKSGRH